MCVISFLDFYNFQSLLGGRGSEGGREGGGAERPPRPTDRPSDRAPPKEIGSCRKPKKKSHTYNTNSPPSFQKSIVTNFNCKSTRGVKKTFCYCSFVLPGSKGFRNLVGHWLRLYRGNCKASAACFVNAASCYTLPIENVLSLRCPFLGRAPRSWAPWVVLGWQPLDHIGDASCNACQNSYSKPTIILFPGWHWWSPGWSLDGSQH